MTITKIDIRPIVRDIHLSDDETWRVEGDLRGEQITCTAGKLWITQEKDMKDYILNRGDIFWVTQSGAVVVQAMQDGQFTFSRINRQHLSGRT